jgi:hypothetical protein
MRGVVGGHDGARRCFSEPIHTTLWARMEAVLRLDLITESLRICPDHPRHHRLRDQAPLRHRGIEHGEIEQGVRMGNFTYKNQSTHKKIPQFQKVLHTLQFIIP